MAVHRFGAKHRAFQQNFTHGEREASNSVLDAVKTGLIPLKPHDEGHFLLALERVLLKSRFP
jgi:hypothetical protein